MSPPTFYLWEYGKVRLFRRFGVDIVIWCIQQSISVCVAGKRYNLADVSAALSMSLGLIWFTLADSKVAPNFNVTGISFSNS